MEHSEPGMGGSRLAENRVRIDGRGACLGDLRRPNGEACKWFGATDRRAEEWSGPFATVEAAVASMVAEDFEGHAVEGRPIFVGQGRKLTKRERDDLGVDYHWEVEAGDAFEIRLPRLVNDQAHRSAPTADVERKEKHE